MNYLNSFFKKGLIEFGELLDKKKCDEIYNKIINSRNLSKNIFRSKKEYFKNPNPRKTNPGKGFNNLTEKFDLSFVENNPIIKRNLELLLGKDYETVMKNFVIGVPENWMPKWLKVVTKKQLAPNLGAYIKNRYRDVTYFRGIDFHMDLIDHPKLVGRNLTLYIYLNQINNRMSPLQIIEKSHIFGATKFPHYIKNNRKNSIEYSSDNKNFKKFKKKTIIGNRGNVYLWSSFILHGTNPQKSNIPRISLRYDEQIISIQKKAEEMTKPNGNIEFKSLANSVEFKNVYFSYNKNQKIIENLSLKIKKGEFVAFVGKSGGGKSTIIDIILGLNSPQAGKILIDQIELDKYEISSFREKIGYVPQGGALFNDTIAKNIKWSTNNASENIIKEICKETYSDEFIDQFPEKYDTVVGDRGVKLSGGQLQRIALARALIKNPDIIVLDEATSSLDTHSEKKIQKSLESIYDIKTIIVIAHRLSTIIKADTIYVIDGGKIIEEGNYKELTNKNGYFKKMIDDQKFINT